MSFLPINRVSIGIQSFHDSELKLMNRRHNSKQAILAVEKLKKNGFTNLSVDIMYGIPESDIKSWKYNLEKTLELDVDHISLYHLTYEPKTIFTNWVNKQKLVPVDERISIHQFEMLIDILQNKGYEHYEISNFARNKMYSRHNTSYWTGENYIGVGPSAHSYNGKSRSWNINVNPEYITAINNNQPYFSNEKIDTNTRYNEFIMTSLRTIWGFDLYKIEKEFSSEILKNSQIVISKFEKSGDILVNNNVVTLSPKGKFISDYIISEFFIV